MNVDCHMTAIVVVVHRKVIVVFYHRLCHRLSHHWYRSLFHHFLYLTICVVLCTRPELDYVLVVLGRSQLAALGRRDPFHGTLP